MTELIQDEPAFPFTTKDLKYWIIKRKDGIISKYNLISLNNTLPPAAGGVTHTPLVSTSYNHTPPVRLREWCNHSPNPHTATPLFEENGVRLFVADNPGLKNVKQHFQYILDCGDVLRETDMGLNLNTLVGDPDLVANLSSYTRHNEPRLLKVDWNDRQAPPLLPQFFIEYAKEISGNVVTACQGGHGRSGSAAVMLMMVFIPSYTPYQAICHLRALHCPRAIESKEQHEYIGKFAEYLGRENDVDKVETVSSYKDAFLAITNPAAEKYQKLIKEGKGAQAKADPSSVVLDMTDIDRWGMN